MESPGPRPAPLEPLYLYPSRLWTAFVCAIWAVVVGHLAYWWVVLIGMFRGATYLWVFGTPAVLILLWILYAAWQFRPRKPVVIIDADGITDYRISEYTVPWDDIVHMTIRTTNRGGTNLIIKLENMEAVRKNLGRLRLPFSWMDNRAYGGHWLLRLTSLKFDGTEVLRRANAFASQARTEN